MKKILFITPRNPFSGRYSGDVIRSKKFINYLKKKYQITVLTSSKSNSENNSTNLKFINFKNENFVIKFFFTLFSILKLKPLQLGFFYSSKIKNYVIKNYQNFDIVFCQSVRTAQYVLDLNINKKVLDMGDLYSSNYLQTFRAKNIFNPIKLVYFVESMLMKKYESLCLKSFCFQKKK